MGVDLRGVKMKFASLMDEVQPMVTSQFVVWLDEKVSEFKVQGYMDLDASLEAPKWIKDYSMSMLVSGVSLTAQSNGNDEDMSKQRTPAHRKDKVWSTGGLSSNRHISRASVRKSAVPSLIPQTVHESVRDSDSGSNASQIRKRLAPSVEEDNDDDGFEIIEVKRERLNSNDESDVTYELHSPETSRTNTDSISKSVLHNRNLHSKMATSSSSASKVSHVRTLNSQSLNTLANRLSGVLASQKQTHNHTSSAVKSLPLAPNQISHSPRLGVDNVSAVSNSSAYSGEQNDDVNYSQDDSTFDVSADLDDNPPMNTTSETEDNSDTFVMTQGALRLKGEAVDEAEPTGLSTEEFYSDTFLPKISDSRMLVPARMGVSSAASQEEYSDEAGPSNRDDEQYGIIDEDIDLLSDVGDSLHHVINDLSDYSQPVYESGRQPGTGFFQCIYCQTILVEISDYRKHLSSQHVVYGQHEYDCIICGSVVQDKWAFVRHCVSHALGARAVNRCPTCSRTFTRGDNFRRHLNKGSCCKASKRSNAMLEIMSLELASNVTESEEGDS